jgi:hypothetical protein
MRDGYIGRAARGGVSSVDPCAREKSTSPTLVDTHEEHNTHVWLSPPREEGGVTAKNLYGCGGRCEGRGERDERWDEISVEF